MARDVPRKLAMDMLLTARLVHADEAKEIGFVNYVVPAEELMDKALEIASTIAKNAPLSLKFTKQIVHAASQMSEEDAMRYCDAAYRFIEKTEDGIEGPAAFVEKRTPNWQGKYPPLLFSPRRGRLPEQLPSPSRTPASSRTDRPVTDRANLHEERIPQCLCSQRARAKSLTRT